MPIVLVDGEGRVRTRADGTVIVGEAGDPCCCGGACDPVMLCHWCCGPSIDRWVAINRAGCLVTEGEIPISEGAASLIVYELAGGTACYVTDPTMVVERAELPQGAIVVASPRGDRGDQVQIGANCTDARCPICPECCGSVSPAFGQCGMPPCCNCGRTYELRASMTYSMNGVFKAIVPACPDAHEVELPEVPWRDERASWRGSAAYDCDSSSGAPTRVVFSTGNSGQRTNTQHKGDLRIGCCDGPEPGYTLGIGSSDTQNEPLTYPGWPFAPEGCGLGRAELNAMISPFMGNPPPWSFRGTPILVRDDGMFTACAGSTEWAEFCGQVPGQVPCPPGGAGHDLTTWSGTQGCFGGTFRLTRRGRVYGTMPTPCTVVEGGTCSIAGCDANSYITGMVELTVELALDWEIVDRVPCVGPDPCLGGAQREAMRERPKITPKDLLTADELQAAVLAGPWGGPCVGCS